MDGIVYFLQAADGPVKVGWCSSRDGIARRLRAAQLGHPARLQVVAAILGDRTLEHQLHHRWRNHRLEGEWFRPNPDMLGYLAGLRGHPSATDPHSTPPPQQQRTPPQAMRHARYWIDVVTLGALAGGLAGAAWHPLAGPVAIAAMAAIGIREARRPPRTPYPLHKLNVRSTMRALGWSVKILAYIYLSPLIAVRAIWRGLYRPRVRVRL